MSNKSSYKGQKKPQQPPAPPRTAEEIQKEYLQLCCTAGEVQFKVENSKAHLSNINVRIQELDAEMKIRQQMDARAKEQEASKDDGQKE